MGSLVQLWRRADAAGLAVAAGLLIAVGLRPSLGRLHPLALVLITAALLAGWLALRRRSTSGDPDLLDKQLRIALLVAVATHLVVRPMRDLAVERQFAFAAAAGVALVCALVYTGPRRSRATQRLGFLGLLLAFAVAALVCLTPPEIDVWMFRQEASGTLLAGANPYARTYPNIYGDTRFYSPALLEDGAIVSYPYPPLTVLFDVPWYWFLGDVRYGTLVALLLGVAFFAWRLGTRRAQLLGLLVLWQPTTFFVLNQAWTEPLVFSGWTLALAAVVGRPGQPQVGARFSGMAAGFAAALKQYTPLFLLPLAWAVRPKTAWRAAAVALGVVTLTALPFALADPYELVRDVVMMQVHQPFRPEALSYPALVQRLTGVELPSALAFLVALIVLWRGVRHSRSPMTLALSGAVAFLAFVLFNKQAFCNYYWLAAGLFFSGAALSGRGPEDDVPHVPNGRLSAPLQIEPATQGVGD